MTKATDPSACIRLDKLIKDFCARAARYAEEIDRLTVERDCILNMGEIAFDHPELNAAQASDIRAAMRIVFHIEGD